MVELYLTHCASELAHQVSTCTGACGQSAAGMITALDGQGVSLAAIMQRSGHRSYQVASRYVRHADPYKNDPLAKRARGADRPGGPC